MRIRTAFFLVCAIGYPSFQALKTIESAQPQAEPSVVIVELFTSEGCSSCPPADALLQRIQGRHTAEGQLIVGISEHVTYWNHLGWDDPYSAEVFTDRQNVYAGRLSPDGPYTPQMVLNGHSQFVGSDERALVDALHEDAQQMRPHLTVLSSTLRGDSLVVQFSLEGTVPPRPFDVIAVLTDDLDRSSVLHGENAGKNLQHASVARALTRVMTGRDYGVKTVRIALPPAFVAASSGHHLVLFAQESHQGLIVAAAFLRI